MNQFLSNKIIASIVALALLVGVGVLVSSGDTSSTTRNAALVVVTPCTKPGQVTKVSKQSVVCAALSPKNIWYPVFQEKKWICAKLGITRKQNGVFSVCGKSKSSKKRWFLTKPLMANSNPGLPTTDQDAFIKLTTNPELIVETSPTTPPALAATTETTLTPTTETSTTETPATSTPTTVKEPTSTPTTVKEPTSTTTTVKEPTSTTTTVKEPTSTTITPKTDCERAVTCNEGDVGPGGGNVFYVATTAFNCGVNPNATSATKCKYLEAAPNGWNNSDSDPLLAWGNGGQNPIQGSCSDKPIPGAVGTSIGSGFANTAAIMIACPDASGNQSASAARAASRYAPSGKAGGWFLPSRDELTKLCEYSGRLSQATVVYPMQSATCYSGGPLYSGFSGGYWSSSAVETPATATRQANYLNAVARYFVGGSVGESLHYSKWSDDFRVRPVRAFCSASC